MKCPPFILYNPLCNPRCNRYVGPNNKYGYVDVTLLKKKPDNTYAKTAIIKDFGKGEWYFEVDGKVIDADKIHILSNGYCKIIDVKKGVKMISIINKSGVEFADDPCVFWVESMFEYPEDYVEYLKDVELLKKRKERSYKRNQNTAVVDGWKLYFHDDPRNRYVEDFNPPWFKASRPARD